MAKLLLIAFDFDHTVVEHNTDTEVRRILSEEILAEIKDIQSINSWTIYMEHIFRLLHKKGVRPTEIEKKISSIPPVVGFPSLMKNLNSNNVEIIIISDSNSFFINHWLKSQKLDQEVQEIFTNPAWFDDSGLLNIKMYHVQDWCKMCNENICKGSILENYVKRRSEEGVTFDKVAYAGDGSNDLCPVLRLSEKDFIFPRINYALIKKLNDKNNDKIPKAEIIPWKDGTDIWKELVQRIPELDLKS